MSFLQGVFQDAIVGKFTLESMEMALKAVNHDEDIAEAAEAAEVKGRNTRIKEQLRKRGRGDGTVALNGKNGGSGRVAGPDLGALGRMGGGTIWERGGEKRRSH